MDRSTYTKRLEEILDEQFKRLDGTTVLPIYNRPTAVGQAITAIQQLNNEAIGQNTTQCKDVDAMDAIEFRQYAKYQCNSEYDVDIAVDDATDQLRQELKAVIGVSND